MNLLFEIPETRFPKNDLVSLTVSFKKEHYDLLKDQAKTNKSSISMIIRLLLETYYDQLQNHQKIK